MNCWCELDDNTELCDRNKTSSSRSKLLLCDRLLANYVNYFSMTTSTYDDLGLLGKTRTSSDHFNNLLTKTFHFQSTDPHSN